MVEGYRPIDNEGRIYAVLSDMWHNDEIDGVIRISFKVARINRWRNLRGVDFLITRDREGFPIESKSSGGGEREHEQRGRMAPVVIPTRMTQEELAGHIRELLGTRYDIWSSEFYNTFHSLLDFSLQKPHLMRGYPPLYKHR